MYYPTSVLIKHFVTKSLNEKKINSEDLSILAFSTYDLENNKYDLIWKKPGKEFKFNEKMYDIEGSELKGDSVYYTVYCDHKENVLEAMFALHFNNTKKDNSQNPTQRILLIGIFSEDISLVFTKLNDNIAYKIPLQKKESKSLNNFPDIPTPPPRLIV